MSQGHYSSGCSNYKKHNLIIPNGKSNRDFDVEEVEVYLIV